MRAAHLTLNVIGLIVIHVAYAVWAITYSTRGFATCWYAYGPLAGIPAFLSLATNRTLRHADDRSATALVTLATIIAGITLVTLIIVLWEAVPMLLGESGPVLSWAGLIGFFMWAFMLWPSGIFAVVVAAAVPPAPIADPE